MVLVADDVERLLEDAHVEVMVVGIHVVGHLPVEASHGAVVLDLVGLIHHVQVEGLTLATSLGAAKADGIVAARRRDGGVETKGLQEALLDVGVADAPTIAGDVAMVGKSIHAGAWSAD